MKLLNIGCGGCYHPDWTNIDLVAATPEVREVDLRGGLPFPEEEFEGVYHSHVLEHLAPDAAKDMLKDCFRVLKPGGVLRVVVPDLEGIVRQYLTQLDASLADPENRELESNHQWMTLELIDQLVRTRSGGEMGRTMRTPGLRNETFIRSRLGAEFDGNGRKGRKTIRRRLQRLSKDIRRSLATLAVTLCDGYVGRQAYLEGRFRQQGEIHRWMYDRVSLPALLRSIGFDATIVRRADESGIKDFNRYELDQYGGRLRKPDSLFVEAIRPSESRACGNTLKGHSLSKAA